MSELERVARLLESEVNRLREELKGKDEVIERAKDALALQLTNFTAKYAELNEEIAALKATLQLWKEGGEETYDFGTFPKFVPFDDYKEGLFLKEAQNVLLQAANARLREGIQAISSWTALSADWNDGKASAMRLQEHLQKLLSPADGDGKGETKPFEPYATIEIGGIVNVYATKEICEQAGSPWPEQPASEPDEDDETEEEREWIASYNQHAAWKYENYNPETTEYRKRVKSNEPANCWHCNTALEGSFGICCKHGDGTTCGCYGMPTEPPFCSKECHVDFITKWRGDNGSGALSQGRGVGE